MTSQRLCLIRLMAVIPLFFVAAAPPANQPTIAELVHSAKRIVFLGDSITYAGHYVACFEAWLYVTRGDKAPEVIDVGLPSETVSGLSEEGHAGGKFPRPDLHERLKRVLVVTKPDLVFACYGINCGIYQPFDAGRFEKYQHGYQKLKSEVESRGAKLVVITPPFYDDQRSPKAFSYNEVLDKYTDWLNSQVQSGWNVIDLHTAMTAEVKRQRESDPKFTFQPDGVHPNPDGHWFMASRLIAACGDPKSGAATSAARMVDQFGATVDVVNLAQNHVNTLRGAYITAAGHKRPGVAAGGAVPDAEAKAKEYREQILKMLKK